MRGSIAVLALAMTALVARASHAQSTASAANADDKQCLERQRGNPSATGLANRADPTMQGNKDCTPQVGNATISGTVFFDLDNNGVLGSDEVGLSGWEVQLTGPGVSQTTRSGDNGVFSFTGLSAGTYKLCVTMLPGWNQVPAPTMDATCPTGLGYSVVVMSSTSDVSGKDFGFVSQ